jgi:hypothetical protein
MRRAEVTRLAHRRATFFFLITAFALALRWAVPLNIVSVGGAFDDELMVRGAHSIMAGDWLGRWDTLTLAKPAGYPLFLIAAWLGHLSPTIMVSLVLVLGAWLVFTALRRLRFSYGLALFVYGALLLNPALLSEQASRIYRDGFMAALVIVVVGAALWVGLGLRQAVLPGYGWRRVVPMACLL